MLIVGAARSGAAAAALARRTLPQAPVVICDRDPGALSAEAAAELEAAGVRLRLGDQDTALLDGASLVIKSPGVPRTIPLLQEARRRGIAVWGEIEFAWRLLENPVVGVTGTNGKTTTTELIGHILREAGRPCRVAGNVGTALSSLAGTIAADEILVLELSSFQLEDSIDFRADVAVLLNLSEDHRDRHPEPESYAAAKMRIFANQGPEDVAVLNAGDVAVRGAHIPGEAAQVWFGAAENGAAAGGQAGSSVAAPAAGGTGSTVTALAVFSRDDWLKFRPAGLPAALQAVAGRNANRRGEESEGPVQDIIFWPEAALKGEHNRENALAAAAVCLSLGLTAPEVAAGLRSFPGVPHRLQPVARIRGVTYVNDSKATNVDAAIKALTAFSGGIHLILGGSLKGCSFDELARAAAGDKVRQVLVIGQAADEIAASFGRAGRGVERAGGLEEAVRAAADSAGPGDTVLLAPACASYDQYENFEKRGEHFIALVERMRTAEKLENEAGA
ncbi:MAG: UDP-N-acetylmuramoyl-L-alanine--D-glutamate ligase [Thermoleophilia bacterium]